MENPQKIEFKSLDDLVLFTTRRIGNRPFLRNIVLECMPDCKEKLAQCSFYYRHSEFVTYGQPQFLGK
jgi:hypothetical protein